VTTALVLDLELRPDWANIDRANQAIGLLALGIYADPDLKDVIAMVSTELLENALKHAVPDTGVRLSIHDERVRIVIAVTNAVLEPTQVQKLEAHVEWLHSFTDARAAYIAAIEQAVARPASSSGLGICRIAYEGGCGIACDNSEPGRLTVRASLDRLASS
jgi:hypothetical protein